MTIPKISKGESLQTVFRHETVNAMIEAANTVRNSAEPIDLQQFDYFNRSLMVMVSPKAGTPAVGLGDVCALTGEMAEVPNIYAVPGNPSGWDWQRSDTIYEVDTGTPKRHEFVVMWEEAGPEWVGWAVQYGVVNAQVYIPPDLKVWCKRVDMDTVGSGDPLVKKKQLVGCPEGRGHLLWVGATLGNDIYPAVVYLGHAEHVQLKAKVVTADLLPDKSGPVKVWTDALEDTEITAHLDWMHGDQKISIGKEVLIEWFPDEQLWRVIGAECEDPPDEISGQLDQTTAPVDQSVSSGVPEPIEAFDDSLATSNVIANPAAASLTLPDLDGTEVLRYDFAATLSLGGNNQAIAVSATVNGVPLQHGIAAGSNTNAGQSVSLSGFASVIPNAGSAPVIQFTVECDANTTITWVTCTAAISKDSRF